MSYEGDIADRAAVAAVAHDYIDGWYTADASRMDRALHDDLVKRILDPGGSGPDDEMRAVPKSRMVQLTADGAGQNPDAICEIMVDAVSDTIATARVYSPDYVDFLQLLKTDSGWKIVNIVFHNRS